MALPLSATLIDCPQGLPLDAGQIPACRVERVADGAAFEALVPEWQALAAQLSPSLPFHTPGWHRLWWQHLRRAHRLRSDEFFLHVVRDRRGRLLGIAPMVLSRWLGGGVWGMRQLQFIGADPNLTEIRGPICSPEHETIVVAALLGHLDATGAAWDWWRWSGVRIGSVAEQSVLAHEVREYQVVHDYLLPLPDSWDAFRSGRSRNLKESLRKCYNSLKRDGHAFRFRIVDAPGEVPDALARFFALHAARAASAQPVAHADVFADPRHRAFMVAYATQLAETGGLRIFELEIGGAVVASRLGFAFGRELYLYYSGYDPAWAGYSVMTTVVAEAIRWAIGQGYALVNLSTGRDVSKLRWSPDEVGYARAVLLAPRWRSRAAYALYRGASALKRGLRALRRAKPGA